MSDLFSGLANFTKQVTSNISTYEIRKIREKVEGMVLNYTDEELLVREATNEDPWGPTGQQMKDITHLSFQYDGYSKVMPMLWKRLFEDNRQAWRRVYKSLTLLDYLLHHGSERVINSARDHSYQLKALEGYKFIDEKGRDQGLNVRHRVGKILEMLNDDDKLRNERKRAKDENKEKYQGYNSNDLRLKQGYSSNSYSSDSYSSNNRYDDYNSRSNGNSRDDYSNKEVNSFSFPEDPRQSCENDDEDDGFESFAQARSTASPKPPVSMGSPSFGAPPSSSSTSISKLSPPPALSPQTTAPSSAVPTIDLLGLDTALPSLASPVNNLLTISSSTSATDDILGMNSTSSVSFGNLPRPPSNGPSPVPIGDILGDKVVTPPSSLDLFGDFTTHTTNTATYASVAPTPASDWTDPEKKIEKTAEDFANFPNMKDPFAPSAELLPTPPGIQTAYFPDILENIQIDGVLSKADSQKNDNKNAPKLGNTWAGANAGLFNLDNLGLKPAGGAKPSLSLNQLQQTKKP